MLEGVAAAALERYSGGDPIDAVQLAEDHGVEVCYADNTSAFVLGDAVFVPRKTRIQRVHWLVAHELAHVLLRLAGEDGESEAAANYVAGAMLIPRDQLTRQLREGWDLERLRRAHANAPAHAIAVRVVQLRDGIAAVYDEGRCRRRWGRGEIAGERAMVEETLATARPVRVDDCTGAWPVFDGKHRRVIVLAPAV